MYQFNLYDISLSRLTIALRNIYSIYKYLYTDILIIMRFNAEIYILNSPLHNCHQ